VLVTPDAQMAAFHAARGGGSLSIWLDGISSRWITSSRSMRSLSFLGTIKFLSFCVAAFVRLINEVVWLRAPSAAELNNRKMPRPMPLAVNPPITRVIRFPERKY